ncbi:50S ribosomal protein L29 [Nitrosomonas aestuarii]|uniref:Large ribosomal subunit protein uL29 n=1 Tax=Nitrosomonas aestuarii TaxID=52441 RepID=A0A1I3ZD49_9PROT|nr:50S ribosomal protein L29 [Nitrosomonas aestuarii]PTN13028.1 LSU ribosomal protein L29P [Nitrosomonas aestuarii]SFK41516.1 LSU ribosomal protein L29P [Nitrosomonas aestuarii]|tara:strand:- start:66 stop:260 length:195 start_codon:yes stop_codon:yes gene_type:complete
MNKSDIRNMNLTELNTELHSLLRAQFGLRMQLATQQISNPNQLKKVRRDIARVKTLITQRNNEL